jgi:DUF4097 and DUF4098 domain-containing protein YvlB
MKAGKVLLLLAVVTVGAGLQTAVAVRDHLSIGAAGCRVMGGRFEGPSFSFESTASVALPPGASLRLDNAFGAVNVRTGQAGQAHVRLRKVVFLRDEARARELADQVRLSADLEGSELRVRTNRDDFAHGRFEEVGLETHFDVELPPGTPVVLANEHGAVDARDVAAARIEASFDPVRLERVAGDAQVKARHADVVVSGVSGALTLEARHGDVEVRDAAGRVSLDVEHGDVALLGAGATELQLRHGDLKAERVGGALRVRGEHAGVQAAEIDGAVDVETGFRDVTLRGVRGDVRVASQHATVSAEDVSGTLHAEAAFDDVKLTRVKGRVEVQVEHGGVRAEALEGGAGVRASGDAVTLDGFRGPLQIDVRRGDVTLTPAGALADDVAATVTNGALTLVVPAGSRGRFDGRAERGEVTLADVPGLSLVAGDDERVEGVLGGGGPTVTLRTRHGDLRLEGRKAP